MQQKGFRKKLFERSEFFLSVASDAVDFENTIGSFDFWNFSLRES